MLQPMTRNTVTELESLPRQSGEIPKAQVTLEDPQVADFASWIDDQLTDLEWNHRQSWTHHSTLDALFQGTKRR